MVVSDHGFASFRRGMNYNTWLVKNGFMTLNGEDAKRRTWRTSSTRATSSSTSTGRRPRPTPWASGRSTSTSKGREAKGIVKPGRRVRRRWPPQIKAGLEAFVDEETGEHPVAHVFTRDEAYDGVYDPVLIPDLIPSNSEGYRVGWQDSLGGIGKAIVEPNTDDLERRPLLGLPAARRRASCSATSS